MKSRLGACLLAALALAGCREKMAERGKLEPLTESAFFSDGRASRLLPEGAVSRESQGDARPALDAALLARGRGRFEIYCSVCHGRSGDGDGMIVRRGFPAPPSYHTDALRRASDRSLYDVVTKGKGRMYSYADRLAPRDRWAVVAYIRVLQLARGARLSDVPPEERARLEASR